MTKQQEKKKAPHSASPQKKAGKKKSFFKKILMYLILSLIIIIPVELVSYLYIKYKRPEIGVVVDYLKTAKPINEFQRCISQVYLNYIPSPNKKYRGFVQHNAHGYRGPLVHQKRTGGNTFRILFLGGSTTYGWGVLNPDMTYPACTGKYLNTKFPQTNFEIINGGIPYGTSAEILIHYLLKFRYYKPDLVVINEGGNDAQALLSKNYQPDYSNWRKNLASIPPVGKFTKTLLTSNFFSVLAYHLFYAEFSQGDMFVHDGSQLLAP